MAISVNMLVERFTTEAQPRWKNGHPAQRTTGLASASSIHGSHAAGITRGIGMPGSMLTMAITSNGAVSATLLQKRRVMLRNSGFSSSVAVTVRGSSAMPQMGQAPDFDSRTSGHMGHTKAATDASVAELTGVCVANGFAFAVNGAPIVTSAGFGFRYCSG